MHRHRKSLLRTLIALSALTLWGCSTSTLSIPTAPESLERSSVAKWAPESEGIRADTTQGQTSTTLPTPRDTVISVIRPVAGELGAVLQAGCLQLRIPPGAIAGEATIEMKVRPNGRGVELHIYPESLNNFLIPIELRTDLSAMPTSARTNAGWFFVDEGTGDWLLLPESSVDPVTGVLSAPLHHFSKYEVGNRNLGKAGW